VIMNTSCKPGTEERVKLPTTEWNLISHKNVLSQRDFDMFTLMATNRDIFDQLAAYVGPVITPTVDFYLDGITKLQEHIRQSNGNVSKFKKHLTLNHQENENNNKAQDDVVQSDEESEASCDM
ncbi:hypothetical protein H4Q26_012411, partial [Puccinia striiformis f. sp. tritici PST-130]